MEDNQDAFPLNDMLSTFPVLSDTIIASDDAGLRSNNANTANKNYGGDPLIQTKNNLRSFIMKFPVPADLDLNTATVQIYTDSEDDPLVISYLPDNNWSENTITYNNTNFAGEQILGVTSPPANGVYSFELPLSIIPQQDGEVTLHLYDPADPNNSIENLYTKEYIGDLPEDELGDQAPRIIYNYNQTIEPRIDVDQSSGQNEYALGGLFNVGFRLTQAPTATVYLPIQISDESVANINGDQVLSFTPDNWDTYQSVEIDAIEVGLFDIALRPLHSDDTYYNGTNPTDLPDYNAQATDITNLDTWTVATGSAFSLFLAPISSIGASTFQFSIEEGPSGLAVTEFGGAVSFSPLTFQIGTHDVVIRVTDEFDNVSLLSTTITVTDGGASDPAGIYVDLGAADNTLADGTAQLPFNSVVDGIDQAITDGVSEVPLRGGEFDLTAVILITEDASNNPITIKPLSGEAVKINFGIRTAFQFTENAKGFTLEGIEIDGGTDELDFWCIVGQAVWGDLSIERGGGLAVIAEGEDITIRKCYIHDAYQKGVEIRGRYINIEECIIRSIATTSISDKTSNIFKMSDVYADSLLYILNASKSCVTESCIHGAAHSSGIPVARTIAVIA